MKGYGSPFAIENIYAFGNGNRDCCISKMNETILSDLFFFEEVTKSKVGKSSALCGSVGASAVSFGLSI